MIQAVIFDMDGLLINSEPFWEEVDVRVFGQVGIPLTREETKVTMGFRVDEIVEHWYQHAPWEHPTKKEVEAIIVQSVIDLIKEKGETLPGVMEAISFFEKRKIPMAIGSSADLEIILTVVEKFDIKKYMQVIHSAEHEPYGKPHPGVYITVAEKLGMNPKNCLVFEDSPNGILAAKAAKMKCVAVPDISIKNDKRLGIADLVLNSLQDFNENILASLHTL